MQIALSPSHFDFGIDNATETVDERGNLFGGHTSITDKSGITLETFRIGANIVVNRFATSLFFSLNQYTHVDRQAAVNGHEGLQGLENQHGLAFVVTGTATVEIIPTNRGLKRR